MFCNSAKFFALNKLNGLGEYHRKDGSLYSGIFYCGHPQGNGRETFKDGSFFEGFYEKGKKNMGNMNGKIKIVIKDILKRIYLMVLEPINGVIKKSTKVIGKMER